MAQNTEQTIYSIMKEMFQVSKKSKDFIEIIANEEDGLSQNHIWLLLQLKISDGMKITEIASNFHITPGAATSMCDRLEMMGFVARVREKNDRRVVRVVLTEKGDQKVADIFMKFSSDRLNKMEQVLKEVNHLMDQII